MARWVSLSLGVLLAICCWTVPAHKPSYGEKGSELGIQVFQQVARLHPQDNVVLSPHGVASILGMLLPGSHKGTRRQLLNALHYKGKGPPYRMLKNLHKNLTTKSNLDMVTIANALFVQQGFNIEEPFVTTNKDNFQCESRNLDFSDTHMAAASINNWVKNRTKGMITSLINPSILDPTLTRLVVVNSIYFKGLWKSRFQVENTKQRNFHGPSGTIYKVPMMSQLSIFNIDQASTPQGITYTVIELPYHGDSISMLIVMPTEENTPVSAIIPHISTATIRRWTGQMKRVRLLLPRFSAEAEVDLKALFLEMGITDMFSQAKADFRHISKEPLHVSEALQKAKIEVNEDGTKATAATTAVLMARSSPPWVTVDRPFLFVIRHKPTGTVLFMGQINKP